MEHYIKIDDTTKEGKLALGIMVQFTSGSSVKIIDREQLADDIQHDRIQKGMKSGEADRAEVMSKLIS